MALAPCNNQRTMFKKTIISEFFTTVSFSQALNSLYLMTFWVFKIKYWKDKELFEQELLNYLWKKESKIISFYNWRSAIYHCLKMIWVGKNDEVIVNSYTCSVVVNAIIQSQWKIKYSDIEAETLSFDFDILKKNITQKTKVVIIQHTFWKQARDYKKIIDFCKEENILIIEDCAHSLGNNSELLWDFAIYSTGRDKVISSITWWFLVINNKKYCPHLASTPGHSLLSFQDNSPCPKGRGIEGLKMPSTKLIFQNLLYNLAWYKAYKLYDFFKLWRVVIFLSRKLNLITEILDKKEKNFEYNNFELDFPNSLVYLARKELKKLDEYTEDRFNNSIEYIQLINNKKIKVLFQIITEKDYNWFRFPILLNSEESKNKLIKIWRKNNIIFWNQWSGSNIIPTWIDLEKAKYTVWSCPVSEDISKRILTLPNHKMINIKDLERVVKILNNF